MNATTVSTDCALVISRDSFLCLNLKMVRMFLRNYVMFKGVFGIVLFNGDYLIILFQDIAKPIRTIHGSSNHYRSKGSMGLLIF